MRHQASRTIALMLGVLIVAAPAAQAGTITYGDVVRTVGDGGLLRPASEVRLRLDARGAAPAQSGQTQSGAASSDQQPPAGSQQTAPAGTTNVSTSPADPTLSQSGGRVETVDLGDVTGTVCDCGEIPPPPLIKGGFPWWWTLAGIPVICVSGICTSDHTTPDCTDTGTCSPPTTPTPTPTPEPMTLLLFGSGLLALGGGARRRRRQLRETINATAEEV